VRDVSIPSNIDPGGPLCVLVPCCVSKPTCVHLDYVILRAVMCPCAVLCVKANMCALGLCDSEGCQVSLCRVVCQSQHVCTWIT
jgi:hypothetical protein